MKHFLLLFLLTFSLSAKTLTPNDVFGLGVLIQDHIHTLLKHYKIVHHHDAILKRDKILNTNIMPRHKWQKAYEILVKINMFRIKHNLVRIEPVGIEARLSVKHAMVYEMNMRILTELKIIEMRNNMPRKTYKLKTFTNKTPLDNYNLLVHISAALDELNEQALTPSYVFSETMRIYDDITIILNHLGLNDETMPSNVIENAIPEDAFKTSFEVLSRIARLQRGVGIDAVDFSEFQNKEVTPSDVYTLTGLIIAELQTIKAFIGLTKSITTPATSSVGKKTRKCGTAYALEP
ncbi:MAG: hypothetical protein Q9M43_10205 [Sulfurimonas sp.]|nr:hypothetical protein [Sulfurimonas sp.]